MRYPGEKPLADLSPAEPSPAGSAEPTRESASVRSRAPAEAAGTPSPGAAHLPDQPALPSQVGAPVAPFRVSCLTKGDVLLLVLSEGGESRAARRFALDLLSAASGIWGGEAAQLAFDWPQPGIENNAETQRKALGAFVAKQIGDHDGGLMLIGAEVVERLSETPAGALILAPLEALMTRGELKRELWREIESRRGAG